MESIVKAILWIVNNYQVVLTALVAFLSGIIAIALLIPGEQPEKTLQKIVDFLAKFSKK